MREVVVGLLGAGNVGGGVVRILQENQADIERRMGASVRVKKILVRDVSRTRDVELPPELLTTDPREVIDDPEIRQGIKEFGGWPTIPQLYVNGELVGGSDILREMYESGELQTLLSE